MNIKASKRGGILFTITAVLVLAAASLMPSAASADSDRTFDIAIPVFDAGIPEDQSKWRKKGIYPEIRRAEARFLAMELADTLRQTGQWGAVNVVPTEDIVSDIVLYGAIEESTGATVELSVVAVDARGKTLSKKKYSYKVEEYFYDDLRNEGKEFY